MKAQWDRRGGRILLGDNTFGGGGHATADRVPVCWSLDLSCSLNLHGQLTACTEHSFGDWRRIRLYALPAETSLLRNRVWDGVGWGGMGWGVSVIFSERLVSPSQKTKWWVFTADVITSFHLLALVGFIISCCLTSLRYVTYPLISAKFAFFIGFVSCLELRVLFTGFFHFSYRGLIHALFRVRYPSLFSCFFNQICSFLLTAL